MLHVLDGDARREPFQRAGIEGDVVVWRGMMSLGPAPSGLRSEADMLARCEHLRALGVPPETYRADIAHALARIRGAAQRGEEVVLWLDLDLFCRVDAAFLAHASEGARLTNALGTHSREDLRALFDARVPLAPTLARAWDAYASADPRALLPLARDEPWIALHLRRFPDARTGLDLIETRALEALQEGPLELRALHARVAVGELGPSAYGLGDLELARAVDALARGPRTLARVDALADGKARAAITSDGRDALAGRADRFALQDHERWLGGVRITGAGDAWRWDAARGALIAPRGSPTG